MPRSLSSPLTLCALLLALSPLHPFTPSPLQPLQAAEAKPAPRPGTNDDESKVPPYTLPDALICRDGSLVTDAKTWNEKRRPELLELFKSQMHGRSPDKPDGLFFKIESDDTKALNGLATRLEIAIHLAQDADAPQIHLLLYIPNNAKTPVPVFISPNFDGNHSIDADPKISIREEWTWNGKEKRDALVRPAESTRGKSTGRWELETIIKRGFALATFARNEVEPDYAQGWTHGIRGYYLRKSGKKEFAPDDWGAVAAWAWACSRALDYLETDKAIDAKHAIVLGHSRLGKAALWAGASDPRFALVISNDSGEGGAALARRWYGETTAVINRSFPHWFCANFKQYGGNEAALPFDQHELLALVAPRPLYVASAEEDRWSDPKGEFLSAKFAGPVYKLFGKTGVNVDDLPAVNTPVGETIGYHIRTGKHDVTDYDWNQYLNFAERHFK